MVLCINCDENFRKYFDLSDHFRPLAKKKGSSLFEPYKVK